MRDGEGGDGLGDQPAALEQQDQREHEKQMVEAQQDMLHADDRIGRRDIGDYRWAGQGGDRLVRCQAQGLHGAVDRGNADQRIGG